MIFVSASLTIEIADDVFKLSASLNFNLFIYLIKELSRFGR
jgi:hypothetical protein